MKAVAVSPPPPAAPTEGGGTIVPYTDTAQAVGAGLQLDDAYQTAAYARADALAFQAEARLYLGTTGTAPLGIPFLQRPLPESLGAPAEWSDGVSPYGYPGIITGEEDPARLVAALERFARLAAEHNVVSLFLRMHPMAHPWTLPVHPTIQHLWHGQTVTVDLTTPEDETVRGYSSNHRRDIRRLTREGYSVRIDDWSSYPDFQIAYAETMSDRAANSYYHFPPAYFDEMRQPELRAHLVTAHQPSGELVSGGLFFAYRDIVQYHLGGTRRAERAAASSKLVFDAAIRHFRENGCRLLHLGGGFGSADDALFRFKAGFGEGRARFSTIRIQCDPERYAALAARRLALGDGGDARFFPAYRS